MNSSISSMLTFLQPDSLSLDLEGGFLRAWWFEPLLATGTYGTCPKLLENASSLTAVCFGIFINLYWYYERALGLSSNTTFHETVSLEWGPLFYSGVAYWVGICIWKSIIPSPCTTIPDGIPSNAVDCLYLLAELTTGVVAYDAIFFFIHWGMHEIPFLRSWHRRHHEVASGASVEARDTLRHGLLDGSLQVLINIFVQRRTPWGAIKSRLARGLHNVFVIWFLCESHSSSPKPYIWRRWLVGVREHYLHHRPLHPDGNNNKNHFHRYQQFFGYLDDLRLVLGTWQLRWERQRQKTKSL
eukprot:scaffold34701_cov229-Amphora_coffeaeformis.AAC.6